MNVLVIGSGGREHALVTALAASPKCGRLYCTPGNPGIAEQAECVSLPIKGDFEPLIQWCHKQAIDLVVVGPEDPLAAGLVDALQRARIPAFGPTAEGARLEADKRFAKQLMVEAGIPTAGARHFSSLPEAMGYLERIEPPYVIKATGLAAGKGVTIAENRAQAEAALSRCLEQNIFGPAGEQVLIETFLEGEEASLLAFTDGHVIRAMASSQDHKPVYDGDEGPNTGGMGAYSPAPVITPELYAQCQRQILQPCLDALKNLGIDYRGVLYAGLMITREGPHVVEFNCRFGDPETQALLPRLRNDLLEVMLACTEGRLESIDLQWREESAVCVIAASGGYPGPYEQGKLIRGLDRIPANHDVMIFHAGTAFDEQQRLVTAGGRVLGLTVKDTYLRVAIERAYELMEHIHFENMHYRTDIGYRALGRQQPR